MNTISIKEKLINLGQSISEIIAQKKRDGTITPEIEEFSRWKLRDFKYGKDGIVSSSANLETFTKPSWFRADRFISEEIKKSDEYKEALQTLKAKYPRKDNLEYVISTFVGKLVHEALYEEGDDRNAVVEIISQRLIDDLDGKSARFGAEIIFQGIVLEPEEINIPEIGVLLRQPIRADLEKAQPNWGPSLSAQNHYHLAYPSAIAELSFDGHHGRDIQSSVEKLTVTLRLFRVGSVKHLSYQMKTNSLLDISAHGRLTSGGNLVALEKSYIRKSDTSKFKDFIKTLDTLLPDKFYKFGEGEVLPATIAFDRYNDALLRVSIVEERITNAVSGLEALLTDRRRQGSYVLSILTAKAMSVLGRDPEMVRAFVEDAYKIRNLFIHGAHLSDKRIKELESKYGEIKNILLEVLDYLRCLMVVSIVSEKDKNTLVQLLEDSLLFGQAEKNLNVSLSTARNIL